MPVSVEGGTKPVSVAIAGIRLADGQPAAAGDPSGVDCAGSVTVSPVEVQRPYQFVAAAALFADRFRLGHGKRCYVDRLVGFVVPAPVAVKVVADGVQLLQVGDLYEAVAIGIVFAVGCRVAFIDRGHRGVLLAELLPGCGPVAIEIDLQGGILTAGSKVPKFVSPGRKVAIPVRIVNVGIPVAIYSSVTGR